MKRALYGDGPFCRCCATGADILPARECASYFMR